MIWRRLHGPFVLSHGRSFKSPPAPTDPFEALERTEAFWRNWSDLCPQVGPWTDLVKRSLITLKALTYAQTGGIVAGCHNVSFRAWAARGTGTIDSAPAADATFTLLAFMHLGYYEEARAWRDWLIRAVAGSPDQGQIMYGVGGERWLPELIIPWLPGYENSSPVRIGNEASQQLQTDIFGEIADAMFQTLKAGMKPSERQHALRPGNFGAPGDSLARAGRRHLGSTRRTAALRPFKGDGLGSVRPRGARSRGSRRYRASQRHWHCDRQQNTRRSLTAWFR